MSKLKPIPGYEKEYAITEDGRVWSYRRKGKHRMYGSEKFISQWHTPNGYCATRLSKGCIARNHTIHSLVALAWIPNPEKKPEINHKDGNKTNNHISNLEWVTKSENEKHSWATGLHISTEKHKAAGRLNIKIANAAKRQILSK